MRTRILAIALVLLACVPVARGQALDLARQRIPMTVLGGPWRFHLGDDAAWSSPGYDDSGWSLAASDRPWSAQGFRGTENTAWYRLRVVPAADTSELAIYFPEVQDGVQVFANGRLIGEAGSVPPDYELIISRRNLIDIPADVVSPGQAILIALRVWRTPLRGGRGGGLAEAPRIGDATLMAKWRELQVRNDVAIQTGVIAEFFCDLLTALAGIGLFLLRPKERGYLWWGVSQMLWTLFIALDLSADFRDTPYVSAFLVVNLVMALATYFQFQFYITFLRQPRNWLFWAAVAAMIGALTIQYISGLTSGDLTMLEVSSTALVQACVVGVLWRGGRGNRIDAALLLVPNCITLALRVVQLAAFLPFCAQAHWARWMQHFLGQMIDWPFRMSAFDISGLFAMFAVLVILLRSYVHSRSDEERLEAELEAARAVQKVLIPDEVPTIPGFSVHTVYRPASQVGGDFFQIISTESGGALIVIGDVSGKGMPAAMTVSLLVGTVSTLAHYTEKPGEILAALNARMLVRNQGGFTTCLVLRAAPDGALQLANAGHIAPYLNGKELAVENGLPLGVNADAVYHESTYLLPTGSQLTLLSDGVVEARNAEGELFGFERTSAISSQPAETIAREAERFGQEDDITVLTLSLLPA